MENCTKFSIFFLLIISPLVLSIHLVHGEDNKNNNNNDIKKLPSKAWGKVKSFFSDVKQKVFKTEQVHTQTKVEEGGESTVKKAAEKSIKKGEEVMEGTAKSAADAAGKAANKAGEMATKAKDKAGEAATKTKEKVEEEMPSKGHHEGGHDPNHHHHQEEEGQPQVEPQTPGKDTGKKKQDEL